ncbi:MAG TPA: hypothetical protein VN776_03240 [Terracidiphilus sp.]|nr:hypothetical protein [Terracidiphilus sp.]
MKTIWVTTAEVRVQPGDMSSGDVLGFMRITMWASSEAEFLAKVRAYLEKYKWELLSAEATAPVDPGRDYGDEANEIIDEISGNEDFVGLGKYYSYKPN